MVFRSELFLYLISISEHDLKNEYHIMIFYKDPLDESIIKKKFLQ